jgi:hypothetical protein
MNFRQTALWTEIQGNVTRLSDQALEEIFEVNAVKEKLNEDKKQLQLVDDKLTQQQAEFVKISAAFSHPSKESDGQKDQKDLTMAKSPRQNDNKVDLGQKMFQQRSATLGSKPSWKQ